MKSFQKFIIANSESPLEYKLVDFALEYQSNEDYIDFYFVAVDGDDKTLAATFTYQNVLAQKTSKEALVIVSKGRPICGLCFNPINEDGHFSRCSYVSKIGNSAKNAGGLPAGRGLIVTTSNASAKVAFDADL